MKRYDHALSETLAVVFMAMLVVVAALLLIASMTGVIANLLQKPALLSVQAFQYNTSSSTHIIGIFHQQGDAVNLNGSSETQGVSLVSLTIIDTSGEYPVNPAGTIIHDAWRPGDLLYIYQNGGSYVYSDVPPASAVVVPAGTYTIKIFDNKVKVLLNALTVTIQ